MERQLDGVERIEGILEGMIGRMTVARDLAIFEMSKLDALGEMSSQLKEKLTSNTQKQFQNGLSQPKEAQSSSEIATLQNLIGIGIAEDMRKILLKGNRLDKDLFQSSLHIVGDAIDEAYTSLSTH
jgi:hypothetical protein